MDKKRSAADIIVFIVSGWSMILMATTLWICSHFWQIPHYEIPLLGISMSRWWDIILLPGYIILYFFTFKKKLSYSHKTSIIAMEGLDALIWGEGFGIATAIFGVAVYAYAMFNNINPEIIIEQFCLIIFKFSIIGGVLFGILGAEHGLKYSFITVFFCGISTAMNAGLFSGIIVGFGSGLVIGLTAGITASITTGITAGISTIFFMLVVGIIKGLIILHKNLYKLLCKLLST